MELMEYATAADFFGLFDGPCEREEVCEDTGEFRGWDSDEDGEQFLVAYFKWDNLEDVGNDDAAGKGWTY